VAWDYVQYPVGLARLGHDVYYFEDSGEWPYNLDGGPSGRDWVARDCTPNVQALADVMSRFGLEDKWAYRFPTGARWFGLQDRERQLVVASADLLLNVSGTLEPPDEYRSIPRLAYIDSDPIFTQLKLAKGNGDFRGRVDAHDVYFTFGEQLSRGVPVTGHRWCPTRQPIVLSEWRPTMPHRDDFTTVMSWTSYEPLRYAGQTYGQKDVELKRFLELPRLVGSVALELALSETHHADWETNGDGPESAARPQDALARSGWHVVSANDLCPDLERYRRYVESSKGEWTVAKNGYVVGQPGWFGCRSACYLAAGRPVVVQDTGFGDVLPVGEGILPFSTLDEAAAAIHDVEASYGRHAAAARAIAEKYFDSDKVLARLLEEAFRSDA